MCDPNNKKEIGRFFLSITLFAPRLSFAEGDLHIHLKGRNTRMLLVVPQQSSFDHELTADEGAHFEKRERTKKDYLKPETPFPQAVSPLSQASKR